MLVLIRRTGWKSKTASDELMILAIGSGWRSRLGSGGRSRWWCPCSLMAHNAPDEALLPDSIRGLASMQSVALTGDRLEDEVTNSSIHGSRSIALRADLADHRQERGGCRQFVQSRLRDDRGHDSWSRSDD